MFRFLSDWRAYVAEFFGTFVFVFVASGAVVVNHIHGDLGPLGIAMATGLILSAMVFATVHISGGHLNPAVTLAMWLTRRISSIGLVFYILSQIIASFAAAFALYYVFGREALQFSLGGPVVSVGFSLQGAMVVEAILTAVLVFAIFGTMVDRKGPLSFGPWIVGLVVVAESIFAGTITGAAFNPARAIGPLVVSNSYESLLVWIVGPFTGSLFAFVYEYIFIRKTKK